MRKALALALLLLTIPVVAHATTTRIQRARAAAKAVWGPSVCGNTDAIPIQRAPLPWPVIARASWQTTDGQHTACTVTFATGARFTFMALCVTYEHEVGHLAGYRPTPGHEALTADGQPDPMHSNNQNSVMYPAYVGQRNRHCH